MRSDDVRPDEPAAPQAEPLKPHGDPLTTGPEGGSRHGADADRGERPRLTRDEPPAPDREER